MVNRVLRSIMKLAPDNERSFALDHSFLSAKTSLYLTQATVKKKVALSECQQRGINWDVCLEIPILWQWVE